MDAVYVGTVNSAHLGDVLQSLAAGKGVLCEKPLGVHREEAVQMIQAAKAAGCLLMEVRVYKQDRQPTAEE